MHKNSKLWLADLKAMYPRHFEYASVLELGSKDVNGSVREFFDHCDYTGIDKEPGEGVDIVVDARNTLFKKNFNTIICFSLLEHEEDWKTVLSHNVQFLMESGRMFFSFGSEGNIKHMDVWKPVPHKEFLAWAEFIGLEVMDSFFEEEKYGNNCRGCFNAILKKL